jgi:hypothetical protein
MASKNLSQKSPNLHPDFTVRNEGSIILLTPRTDVAHDWVNEHIGQDNGYQALWPTVTIEPRYLEPILAGIQDAGLEVA